MLQERDVDLGVMGRRVDASVAQDQPDLLERDAMTQHLGRRCVPQDVRALDRRHDAGPLHEASHHRRDAVTVPERPKRRDIAQEHVIARGGRGTVHEVVGDRIPDILRKRQTHLVAGLARDPQRACLPLDIAEAELRYVSGAQPEARQEQQDRAIPPALDGSPSHAAISRFTCSAARYRGKSASRQWA